MRIALTEGWIARFSRVVIVLTASGLQKWMVEDGETYKQIYDADMTDIARESMWRQLEKDGAEGKPSWLKVWTLDIRNTNLVNSSLQFQYCQS